MARITAYLLTLTAAFAVLAWLFPSVRMFMMSMTADGATVGNFTDALNSGQTGAPQTPLPLFTRAVVVFGLLIVSILAVAPITYMYMVTKREEGYEKTFVQVLVLLPIVVTAVVRVVRGDLALAFALAGIVAAVRFRTTLRDLKNAVFAFAAIGIGLASGTGSFLLAILLSFVFCVTVFGLWYRNVGSVDPSMAEETGPMRLAEAFIPGESQKSVAAGREKFINPVSPTEIEQRRENIRRVMRFVRADALKGSNKYDTLILIYADDAEDSQNVAADLIDEYVERSNLVDIFDGPEGTLILAYLVRLSDDAEVGELLHKLGAGDDSPLHAAEMKHIKGLRKMMQ